MGSNLIAAAFLLLAAILFFVTGPWWSGLLALAAAGCFAWPALRR